MTPANLTSNIQSEPSTGSRVRAPAVSFENHVLIFSLDSWAFITYPYDWLFIAKAQINLNPAFLGMFHGIVDDIRECDPNHGGVKVQDAGLVILAFGSLARKSQNKLVT